MTWITRPRMAALQATVMAASLVMAGPVAAQPPAASVVVTTEVLGSLVDQLVGSAAEVTVIMPSGANPHSYEPSARDAEAMLGADVLVSNGLDLEESLVTVLAAAEAEGVTWFQAADHVSLLGLEDGGGHADEHDDEHNEEEEHAEPASADDHEHSLEDPHIWTDPLAMVGVVEALEDVLADAGIDVTASADDLITELEDLDAEVVGILAAVPSEDRKLVTGHRSLGYFAERYGFAQVGTVIPSLSTSGEPSAREMAQLIEDIRANGVTAVFSEEGTPQSVAQAVASDGGATLVPLSTSQLPPGGSYQDLIRDIATAIATALAPEAR